MKLEANSYKVALFIFSVLFLCISCKTLKTEPALIHTSYVILLSDEMDDSYLFSTYESFNIQNVKRSSRSQNQYSVLFQLDSSQIKVLDEKLKSDSNVVQFKKQEAVETTIENSKNN